LNSWLIQLLVVTRYELRMRMRSWPFRIVMFIGFVIPILQMASILGWVYFVSGDAYAGPLFVASNATMFALLNGAQFLMWIVVFFANDIAPRDRRIGVADVVDSRSMSVGVYVVGRVLALVIPVVFLLVLVTAISLAVNAVLGLPVASFGEYAPMLLLLCVPAIAFFVALTALISSLLRRRMLAALVSLGLILGISMLLGVKYTVFDITGFSVSGGYSDLLGYAPFSELIVHRIMYICLTLFLLSGTIFFYPRPDTARRSRSVHLSFIVLFLLAIALTGGYSVRSALDEATRREWREILESATSNRSAAVNRYEMDVDLTCGRGRMEARVKTVLQNRSATDQDSFVFCLNPGFDVRSLVTDDGRDVVFKKNGPVAEVTLETPLAPGQTRELVWEYGGRIDTRAGWLNDTPIRTFREGYQKGMERMMGELPGWVGRRFCFLLPESQWYPIPNSTWGYEYPDKRPANWATARIAVKMPDGHTAVTQGVLAEERSVGDGTAAIFECSDPVPQFSLCAGEYRVARTNIDGVDCALYYAPMHSGNVEFFSDAKDEIVRVIGESLENTNDRLGISYPYEYLSLVEVPAQCRTFSDSWLGRNLLVQPGVLLLKENDFFKTFFTTSYKSASKATKKEGTGATDAHIKTSLLKKYFSHNQFGGDLEMNVLSNYWDFQIDPIGRANAALDMPFTVALSEILLDRHPLTYPEVVTRLNQPSAYVDRGGREFAVGAQVRDAKYDLEDEWLLLPLEKLHPPAWDAVEPPEEQKHAVHLLNIKTEGLLRTLMAALGEKQWEEFIEGFLDRRKFTQVSLADLRTETEYFSDKDVSWIFDQFVSEPVVPGYVITQADAYEIDTGQRERQFQSIVRVANLEEGRGYVTLEFKTEAPEPADRVEQHLFFESREEKEIRSLFTDKPRSVRVLPAHGRNLTAPFETLFVPEEPKDIPGQESVRSIPAAERELTVIVDDGDEGFSTEDQGQKSRVRLAKLKDKSKVEKYTEYRGFGAPRRWQNQTVDRAYGKYVHTRKVKGQGDGTNPAVWSATLPKDGVYEVFFYAEQAKKGRYKITVTGGGTNQEVELDVGSARTGWNSLGKYPFTMESEARVELSDKVRDASRYERVYADAVKWVYQGPAHDVQ